MFKKAEPANKDADATKEADKSNQPATEEAGLIEKIKKLNPNANVEGLPLEDLENVLKALEKKAVTETESGEGYYVLDGKSVTVRGKVLGEGKKLPDDFPEEAAKNLVKKKLVEFRK